MATLKEILGDAFKDGMTLEEVETALDGVTLPVDQAGEITRLNALISKRNTEINSLKDQMKANLSEEERKKKEQEEEHQRLLQRVEELQKQQTIATYTASYVSMGYDPALAKATAEALADGKTDEVFANQKKHQEAFEKKVRAETLKATPKPEGEGSGSGNMTLEKLRTMSPAERYDYSVKHPDEYKALYTTGGNP